MNDPVALFLRRERETLFEAAPPLHAAKLWHEARVRRAAALRRIMSVAGWLIRLLVAAAMLAGFAFARPEAHFLFILLILSVWLTRGACAAPPLSSSKGITQ